MHVLCRWEMQKNQVVICFYAYYGRQNLQGEVPQSAKAALCRRSSGVAVLSACRKFGMLRTPQIGLTNRRIGRAASSRSPLEPRGAVAAYVAGLLRPLEEGKACSGHH
jgi:hypothetical protein